VPNRVKTINEEIIIHCLINGDRISSQIRSLAAILGLETLQEHIDNYDLERDDYTDEKTRKFQCLEHQHFA